MTSPSDKHLDEGKPSNVPDTSHAAKTGQAARPATGGGRPGSWRGGGVSPDGAPGETAEAAASRAEGNAPIASESLAHPPTPAQAAPAEGAGRADSERDTQENSEEKRIAAQEAHAEQPSRHFPHGKL